MKMTNRNDRGLCSETYFNKGNFWIVINHYPKAKQTSVKIWHNNKMIFRKQLNGINYLASVKLASRTLNQLMIIRA